MNDQKTEAPTDGAASGLAPATGSPSFEQWLKEYSAGRTLAWWMEMTPAKHMQAAWEAAKK